jgi:dTDP-4-amino-4,6-dideoxygalactose transaminase
MSAIPFNRPFLIGPELEYIREAVASGALAGGGPFSRRCEDLLRRDLGGGRVMLTPSCTAALEMAALLADIGPDDEVILPSFTFVSTANAFVLRGARPVFVDIRPDTLNLDESRLAAALTPRTKAIVSVHYAGVGCAMDEILLLAVEHGLRVIEDAAQAVGARYRDKALGGIGDLGCFSFHETKNILAGEGGAIVINDPALVERAEIVREKGTNRSQFFRGLVDKYTWVDLGSSFLVSEVVAAYLCAQLEHREAINARRLALHGRYQAAFADLAAAGRVRLPWHPPECQPNGHLFHLICETAAARNALLDHLRARGVGAVFHYVPLHQAPMARKLGLPETALPVTEDLAARLLRLPLHYSLAESEQDQVIAATREFFGA